MSGILEDFRNVFRKGNNVLWQLILINVSVFVLVLFIQVALSLLGYKAYYKGFIDSLQLPASFTQLLFQPWSFFSYFFLHENILHLAFNMLFLYFFGNIVHEYLGNRRLLNIYLLGGMVGGLTYMLAYNLLPYFRNELPIAFMLGASGAAFAVMVAAATLLPNYTFLIMFIGPIRIKYIALFYLVISVGSTISTNAGGNIAHLGGAVLGFVFIKQLRKGRDLGSPISAVFDFIKSLFVEDEQIIIPSKKVTEKTYSSGTYGTSRLSKNDTDDYPNDEEVDALLDKISRTGYESLSRDEKLRLFKASQK
jgi:membrane associated rhomboid family serine protease